MSIAAIDRKHSKKRDEILRVIRSTTDHPGAQWVYDQLKSSIPGLSLATVYRNINLFQREGSVISVGVVDGEERFDGRVEPHPHFVCACCGRVLDYDSPELPANFPEIMEKLEELMDNERGATIDCRKTVFSGLCAYCVKPTA
ncbi:ferric uptake regulator, Fur family [Treponema primitia ZAS-2]|uniref:Ferric uptake regulator, Fur family n=1 Tax=Treponema primitia (strain ATCC BAA-887 / DSM 12427 / ZAS-2) TaxID=545694 RepID=F5YR16_TREPZ|nr:transcriptional repressor [Treponema primitia]AEF83906.1 ferric uptake regulator, Fur family [Treponema primitia ZAS-2]